MNKNNFFLKMLMFMFGIAVFGVDGGDGGGAGGSGEGSAGNGDGDGAGSSGEGTNNPPKGDDKDKSGISDESARLLRELMEKKTALKDTKDQLVQVKEQLKQFDGINVDEVKALLKEREEANNKQLEAKGEWDRLKVNLIEQHNAERAALEERIASLQQELAGKDSSINGLTIGSAFSSSRFIADELTLTPSKAEIVYGSHFEYQDGKIVAYDKPKGAPNRTQLIDSQGEPLVFEKAIAKIIDMDPDKDHLIRSKVKPGSNSGGTEDTIKGQPNKDVKGVSRISQALADRD